jgi:hypothetical protein
VDNVPGLSQRMSADRLGNGIEGAVIELLHDSRSGSFDAASLTLVVV